MEIVSLSLNNNNEGKSGKLKPVHQSTPPHRHLYQLAQQYDLDIFSHEFAKRIDSQLPSLRDEFMYPKLAELPEVDHDLVNDDEDCIYLCGNSLGLQPRCTREKINRELDKWGQQGVHGHLNGVMPWAFCDETNEVNMAKIVGAKRDEVALMNGLTINLHLLMITFYNPTPNRHKILIEDHAFPSDHYAVESQIRLKGYNPEESMICLKPRQGEDNLRHEDILETIRTQGDSIALVMLSGVQYYTGQLFDMEAITAAGHQQGCMVGWDLAHAAGNVLLKLHDWNVDFASWCTYKYLNTGAGGVAGIFVHRNKFEEAKSYPRLLGWWGHKFESRFAMNNVMELAEGARGFRVSNPAMLLGSALEGSLEVFGKTSMEALTERSKLLTGYLELILTHHFPGPDQPNYKAGSPYVRIITPSDPAQRGAQLSVEFSVPIDNIHKQLMKRGVVCDKRLPHVLRLAPAPLYNTFTDLFRFLCVLREAIDAANQ